VTSCPTCRRRMVYLRNVSNQAKAVSYYSHDLHSPCQTVLVSVGNPLVFLRFHDLSPGPASPFATSTSHSKVGVKKRDLRSLDFHARRIREEARIR